MKKWDRKTESVHLRLTPYDKTAAGIVAALTGKSLSSLIVTALVFYIKKKYPLAYKHGAIL